jgi:DHA1 family inner membrane transport protein
MTPPAADVRSELRAAALLRLACAYAVATNGTILMPVIVGALMRRFAVGEDVATGVAGLEIAGIAISCAVLPRWIARAPRRFAWIATLGTLVAQLAGAWLPSLAATGASRGVAGLFEGMLFAVVAAALSNRPAAEKAWGVIILVGGVIDGAILFGAACLPRHVADTGLFAAVAAAFAVMAWPTAAAGRDAMQASTVAPRHARESRWRVLIPIWATMVLVYAVLAGQWAIADLVGQRVGIAPAQSGLLLSLASVLGLVGCVAASLPRSHEWRLPILWAAQVGMAGSVAWFFVVRGAVDFFTAQLLITLAFYAVTPFLTARLSELDTDGSLVARSIVVTFIAVAIGTALAGTMLARLGGLGCGLALGACAILSMPFTWFAFSRSAAAPASASGAVAARATEAS